VKGRNKTPLLGWHPPAELSAWVDDEVERRGGGRGVKSELLTEALQDKRDAAEAARADTGSSRKRQREYR